MTFHSNGWNKCAYCGKEHHVPNVWIWAYKLQWKHELIVCCSWTCLNRFKGAIGRK